MRKSIGEFQVGLENQPLDQLDFPIDEDNYFIPSKTYIDHSDNLSLPFIEKLFARALDIYEQKRKDNRNQVIKSSVPSLKKIEITNHSEA